MSVPQRFDLCIIGAGSGGLSVAAGAAQMGAAVALVERGAMGGDCLNFGCVPSKSLLAAAHAAEAARRAERLGIIAGVPPVDQRRVRAHVRGVIAGIAPHDSVERFERLGVTVIRGAARFTGPAEVEVDGRRVTARRFVVATGSRPVVPPVPGLESVAFLTNETIFDLEEVPQRLIVLGGGPVGLELGQAFRELGAQVTILEQATILSRDDPELVAVLRHRLSAQGVSIREGARLLAVSGGPGRIIAQIEDGAGVAQESASHLLLAVGRKPTVDGLDLPRAGIACGPAGIAVDARLRTTNRRVFAVGDVAGGPQFTHAAAYQAGIVLRNALFRLPAKADLQAMPRVTYTHPELAQVGLSEAQARALYRGVEILRTPFAENDRAQAERDTDGLVKVIVTRHGRILGAGIVGAGAGDLIQTWVLAIGRRLGIGAVASMIAPYPTRGEANKRAAGAFFAPKLFGDRARRLVRLLARLP
ncbi:MAG TPA: FAD-dependent oxidoreductase [Rhodospirillales bacterium]|nr:FAD-dependent oxidoreductase [Rhodospirillales bacterium]